MEFEKKTARFAASARTSLPRRLFRPPAHLPAEFALPPRRAAPAWRQRANTLNSNSLSRRGPYPILTRRRLPCWLRLGLFLLRLEIVGQNDLRRAYFKGPP